MARIKAAGHQARPYSFPLLKFSLWRVLCHFACEVASMSRVASCCDTDNWILSNSCSPLTAQKENIPSGFYFPLIDIAKNEGRF